MPAGRVMARSGGEGLDKHTPDRLPDAAGHRAVRPLSGTQLPAPQALNTRSSGPTPRHTTTGRKRMKLINTAHVRATGAAVDSMRRRITGPRDRGDVPGWVLITIMTAGLVTALWAIAGP